MAVYSNSITLASVSDGQSGVTLYTWIRYSNGAASNPSVTDTVQSDTKQIGFAYNKTSSTASSNYGDYQWSDYIGTNGDDGVGVVSIVEEYYLSTSSTQQTGGSWKTTPDPWVSGKYYWTRSTITWTDNKVGENPTHTDPVLAQGLNSANSTASSANSTANQTSTALTNYITQTDATLGSLQNQIDGQVEVWYFEVDPGTATDPSSSWTTDEEKARHIGDLYYNVDNGHSWRWLDQGAGENPRYIWQQIPDSDAAAALATAQAAQTTANTKRRVFTSTPFVPYDVGDLWVSGNTVKYCQTAKTSGQSYSESDWILTATDDTNALTQVDVYYAINTSESTPPAGYDNPSASANWSTTPPTWEDGKYIWSVTVTYKGGQAQTPTDPVNITGAKGETGAAGAGINTVTITYGYSTSGTDASTVTNWGSSIPSVPQGQFLWTRTVTTYTDGSASKTTYSVSRIGEDGIDGDLYRVDTNYQEVYRTYSVDETTGNEEINYSPTTLTFKVYKEDTLQTCNTNYKYDVSILYNSTDAGGGTTVDTEYIYTFLTQLTGTQPFTLSNNNQTISFNIENFMTLTSSNSTNKTRIENIQRLVREANVFFVITILDSSSTVGTVNTYKILTKHVFSVTNLVTSSLASFSVTADSINAAVRDAKMQFTADGLEITNGSFLIKNNQGQEVFSYVPDAENLYVKGRIEADAGYFNGELRAATGTFAGDISAARGTFKGDIEVGGNSVFGGRLEAASGTFKGELTAATGNFNGTITANEGWIGGFKIGSTALYANVPSGATTTTSQLVLDSATPSIKLGSLTFNGNTSTIHGNSFDINPDLAEFKNINISGKISASVFEVGKTQAVGGSMIFKPSFKVESFTNNTLTISEGSLTDFLSTSLYVAVIDETGESIISHVKPSSVTSSTATFSGTPFSGKRPISLIVLGNDGDIIIGINSYNSNSILLGRGLTIREYDHTDTSGRTQPKLFLGDLNYNSSIIQNGVSGYGLYADNVVLNGSLTTIIGSATSANHTYAGVNTLSPIQAIKFEDDDSNIVFWAGSAGTQAQDIAGILDDNNYPGAPFQVTEKGSLYARQGTFEGAIITRSTIQGVDIYGARIHGTGNNPGLGIYNTSNSITFYRGDYGNNPEETFSIGPNGLQFSGSYFINVGGTGNIDFTGDSFVGNNFTASTFIQGQTLIANDDTNTNTITGTRITNSNTSYIEFSNTMNFNIKNSTISQLQLEETRGVFNTNDLVTQKNLQIGNNSGSAMRFMQVSGGYDLYIA